jgi:tetratricopeptide (TPR) repeat protein
MGIVFWVLRDLAGSRKAHEEALELRTQLAADFPSVPGYRQDQAASHHNVGLVLRALKDLPEAQKHLEASHAVKEKLAKDFPRVPAYQRDLALSYTSLGAFLDDGGDSAAARSAFEQALRVRQDLAAAYPGVPDYRKDVIVSRCNLGLMVEKLGDKAAALKAFREAAAEADRLVEDSSAAAVYRALQGHAHLYVADRCKQAEKYAEALPDYERAIDILAKAPPAGEVDGRVDLRDSYRGRADVLHRLGRHDEAEAAWEQALALTPPAELWAIRYERATALWRARRFAPAAAALEELVRPPETTPTRDYEAACLLALLATDAKDSADEPGVRERYASRCVELLRRAQAKGLFKDPAKRERFRTNPDFDALRDREDFRKLLAEVSGRPGPP